MDANIYDILTELTEVQIGTDKDISATMNRLFPNYNGTLNSSMLHFLEALKSYTNYDNYHTLSYNEGMGITLFKLKITNDGYEALKIENERRSRDAVNNSTLLVNNSLISTNEAVKNTNIRMLEHAERQEEIMLQQSGFTQQQVTFTERQVTLIEQQVTLIATQNNLYRNTLFLAGVNILIGLIILWVTISSNADKLSIVSLQSQLTDQQKEIKRLQLLKSDTVHYVLHYPLLKSNSTKKNK